MLRDIAEAEDCAVVHELDLGQKFGEIITQYKTVYGKRGEPRMVSLLKDAADNMFKIQGSANPELELLSGTLKFILRGLKLYGWKDQPFIKTIEGMLVEISLIHKHTSDKKEPDDFGDWPHP